MTSLVRTEDRGGVRVMILDNPPVNAISHALSADLCRAVAAAEADAAIRAVVLSGANGLFSAGADIRELAIAPDAETKTLCDAIALIELSEKIHVAAIGKTALGGGLEIALACDYRIATAHATVGFPEITLGVLPGGGGTQRLPRLIGAHDALQLMLDGAPISAADANARGLIDIVAEGDVVDAAIALLNGVGIEPRKRRVSARAVTSPFDAARAHATLPPEARGGLAAHAIVDAVAASIALPFARGLEREALLFGGLVHSAPSAALRHLFFAERELGTIPGVAQGAARRIASAGIVGAGTMGTGIAIAFADAGIPSIVIETGAEQRERAKRTVIDTFARHVQRGRMREDEALERTRSIRFANDLRELGGVDVAIEAVFEDLAVKCDVFARLGAVCNPDAILASNTSTLDIDALAAATSRPERVVGLHFFAPANIMKLLEIVRGRATSSQTMATAIALGKTLRKVAVVSANAFGFIGNRMLFDYAREAIALAEEGVDPARVDAVLQAFGMAMGPFAMFDLTGLDVLWRIVAGNPGALRLRSRIVERLSAERRFGQKTGAGIYRYEPGSREPRADPVARELFRREALAAGVAQRDDVTDDEIVQRCIYALINAGADVLRTGVARRAGDIDVAFVHGYGFPPYRGGPMWYADAIGAAAVLAGIDRFRAARGDVWTPSPLLIEVAERGATLAGASAQGGCPPPFVALDLP
jgi:3-hydroxyacyl-CoA dehydrogenase